MAGHWYNRVGKPQHTVVGKNGKERNTSLADAKKLDLWPSVTTVMSVASKGAFLERYKEQQILEAAFNESFCQDTDTYQSWCSRVLKRSVMHRDNTADKGRQLHGALEKHFKDKRVPKQYQPWAMPVVELIKHYFPDVTDWKAEQSFTHQTYGFGGCIDLHSPKSKIVLDFKTKDKDDVQKIEPYIEHHMQSASYAVLAFDAESLDKSEFERYNLYISTRKIGELKLTQSLDFDRDWKMFKCLLGYWQLLNNHRPKEI